MGKKKFVVGRHWRCQFHNRGEGLFYGPVFVAEIVAVNEAQLKSTKPWRCVNVLPVDGSYDSLWLSPNELLEALA